jgi:hypothetical protein
MLKLNLSTVKQRILRLFERAGYVVTKVADHRLHEKAVAELAAERASLAKELELGRSAAHEAARKLYEAARKLSDAEREFRLGRARDTRELEASRAETWELRMRGVELQRQLDALREEREVPDDPINAGDRRRHAPGLGGHQN